MTAPGHLIFLFFMQAGHGHTSFTLVFLICYLLAALIQVSTININRDLCFPNPISEEKLSFIFQQVILLLYIADILIKVLWINKVDPDNSAIPYLTALGDLIGNNNNFT